MTAIKKKEANELAAFLNNFDLFEHLTKETKTLLGYYWKEAKFFMGEEIFQEGDPSDYVYLVSIALALHF